MDEKIYLTEYDKDGVIYAGPRIKARTIKEAERKARRLSLMVSTDIRVIGRLIYELENFEMN